MVKEKNFAFIEWLSNNPQWSSATVQKYESAVRIVSDMMLNLGVISKNIYKMKLIELDSAVFLILHNEKFRIKNATGNNMYSVGIKHYRAYYFSCLACEEDNTFENQLAKDIAKDFSIEETERVAIIMSRVGQGDFRKKIIEKYKQCVVTGVDESKLLIASHIKPWSQCNNIDRISVDNGLLLTPTFDKMFDIGLMTFLPTGKLITSNLLSNEILTKLGVPIDSIFNLKINAGMKLNLEYHNDIIFAK